VEGEEEKGQRRQCNQRRGGATRRECADDVPHAAHAKGRQSCHEPTPWITLAVCSHGMLQPRSQRIPPSNFVTSALVRGTPTRYHSGTTGSNPSVLSLPSPSLAPCSALVQPQPLSPATARTPSRTERFRAEYEPCYAAACEPFPSAEISWPSTLPSPVLRPLVGLSSQPWSGSRRTRARQFLVEPTEELRPHQIWLRRP